MGVRKRITVTLSGLAIAGVSAFTLGAAAPADAQAMSTTPHHSAVSSSCDWGWGDCGDGWYSGGWGGWGDDWGDSWW